MIPELALHIWWSIMALITGACFGSFINVVALRMPEGESIVLPASHCPRCMHDLAWFDNIPVLSFLLLRARCRYCKGPISWQYPTVEVISAGLTLGLYLTRGVSVALAFDLVAVYFLLALAVTDARTFLLPEKLTIPFILLAGTSRFAVPLIDAGSSLKGAWGELLSGLFGGGIGLALLGSVALVGTAIARKTGRIGPDEDAMGWGDLVLISGIGVLVGPRAILAVIFLASIQGTLVGAVLGLLRRGDARPDPVDGLPDEDADDEEWRPPPSAIPFGPFLALGAVECLFLLPELEQQLQRFIGF